MYLEDGFPRSGLVPVASGMDKHEGDAASEAEVLIWEMPAAIN